MRSALTPLSVLQRNIQRQDQSGALDLDDFGIRTAGASSSGGHHCRDRECNQRVFASGTRVRSRQLRAAKHCAARWACTVLADGGHAHRPMPRAGGNAAASTVESEYSTFFFCSFMSLQPQSEAASGTSAVRCCRYGRGRSWHGKWVVRALRGAASRTAVRSDTHYVVAFAASSWRCRNSRSRALPQPSIADRYAAAASDSRPSRRSRSARTAWNR